MNKIANFRQAAGEQWNALTVWERDSIIGRAGDWAELTITEQNSVVEFFTRIAFYRSIAIAE